jgi:uncharacterized protein
MKSEDRQPIAKLNSPTFGEFLKVTTIAYLIMSFVGIEICWWYHKNLQAKFGRITYDLLPLLVIVGASFLFLQICQKAMELFFPSYLAFRATLAKVFMGVTWQGALWLAIVSSFGEEILFRGALQPIFGIWLTSIGFGLVHLDPEGGVSVWTAWAMLAGLLLGSIVDVTGSLWPAIFVHFLVNFVGIYGLSKGQFKAIKS